MASEAKPSHAIDVHTPSVARMYDWLLGGVENYASDRRACQDLLKIAPSTQVLARNNRAFLQRVVRVLARDYGVEQFIDHGSGLPTQDNVHQIAQRINPGCRVVYVDNDPIVLAHGRTTLQENQNTAIIQADMRDTDSILDHEETRRLIDFKRPVAALFVSVLHCLPDTRDERDPAAVIRRVASRLGPGSFMVICQLVSDDAGVRDGVTRLMDDCTGGTWGRVREPDEVRAYFNGMRTLEPGLVDVIDWRPDHRPPLPEQRATDWVEWGGVARL
ncbi:SAM-dependent methyltransferase [Streptomyces sp. UNOB3_S3]|uniref:SAM-dependent methyltransferase n=1 Tax=Streptomyces sp. UNOB3_S3 TaxID=2871682 RepID=UPI001E3A0088|nr:SAM-dependent methyltransferase [Streptomyces sp. UNOB3_S3]MCC3773852.1 SAM-dependent methyltransferase [Streptomyces sp. UNOB3_S3]